jgi:hypothetical protein
MSLTSQQRQQTEARIRAATDQLLRGDLPPAGRCDIKTLARAALGSPARPSTAHIPT